MNKGESEISCRFGWVLVCPATLLLILWNNMCLLLIYPWVGKKEELLECGRLWMPCLMGGGWILCSEDQNKLWDLMFHSQSYKEKEMWLQYLKEVKRILECNIYQSFHIPNSHTIAIFNPRNFSINLAVSPSFVTANLILHLSFVM